MSGLPTQPVAAAYPSTGAEGGAAAVERSSASGAADRLARLQAVTARLARAQTAAEAARVAVATGANAVGADAAMIASLSPDRRMLHVQDSVGYPAATIAPYTSFGLDDDLPAAEAVRTGAPVVIASEDDRRAR